MARRNLIIEVIYAPLVGGSETLALMLCKQWKTEGIATRICCLQEREGALTRMFDEAGIDYDLLDLGRQPLLVRCYRLARYLTRWRPRAIHVHHLGALVNVLLPSYLTGCWRVVYTEHSSLLIARTAWMRRGMPFLSRLVSKVTCVSHKLREFFRQDLRVPSAKVVTVYNGVDVTRFRPCEGPRREGPLRIGAVGRLVDEKDYGTLLRACADLKARGVAFAAEIVGDGPLHAELLGVSRALGLEDNVRFRGRRADIPSLLRDFDIYVLSSHSEGLPIAVLEAMATALPVVATRVGALPEVIDHQSNGLLVDIGDSAALADALAQLIDDPGLRVHLGQRARADVRAQFSIQHATRSYAIYLGIDWSSGSELSKEG